MSKVEAKVEAKVEMYSSVLCPFCMAAKRLLSSKGVDFTEHDVDDDEEVRAAMIERAGGRKTVPQIFINERHIGGYDELSHLESAGALDELLSSSD